MRPLFVFSQMHRISKYIIIAVLTLFSLSLSAQNVILDSITKANKSLKTIQANVVETQYLHSGKTKSCSGKLYFSSPECFSIWFDNEEKIIVNGYKVCFDHGMFHGTFNANKNNMMNNIRCLLTYSFQGKCQQLADECGYNLKISKKGKENIVTLTAKKKKLLNFTTVVLHYDASYKLTEIEYTATTDDHSAYTISNVKYDGALKKDVFAL